MLLLALFISISSLSSLSVRAATAQLRIAHFDLDPLFSADDSPEQVTHNITHLVARIGALRARSEHVAVYLSAFSNVIGGDAYSRVFFPSSHLKEQGGSLKFNDTEFPQGELLARVAREIKRALPDVQVFAWMPTLNFSIASGSRYYSAVRNSYIQSSRPESGAYRRLSPFIGPVWDVVADIYRDLGRSAGAYIDGIVFHDDAVISADEDSNAASQFFFNANLWPSSSSNVERAWQDLSAADQALIKSRYLTQFSLYMAAQAQASLNEKFGLQKKLTIARHVYSSAFTDPRAYEWLAQEPDDLLANYDFVAIEAYPFMEARATVPAYRGGDFCDVATVDGCIPIDVNDYYDKLLNAVAARNAWDKIVFVLQTTDWNVARNTVTDISPYFIGRDMRYLIGRGVRHVGWYADRYFPGSEHPSLDGDFGDAIEVRR